MNKKINPLIEHVRKDEAANAIDFWRAVEGEDGNEIVSIFFNLIYTTLLYPDKKATLHVDEDRLIATLFLL